MSEVITADLVDLDLKAADRQSASRQLAERLVAAGRVTDSEGFFLLPISPLRLEVK